MNTNTLGLKKKFTSSTEVIFAFFCIFILTSQSLKAEASSLLYNDSSSSDQVAGVSSLMSSVANNDIEGVKFFSKSGAKFINQQNLGGATALHIAAREKNIKIAEILCENGANLNISDNEGWTPLMRAARFGDETLVKFLLEKGADASIINSENESAIMHATLSDCDKCLVAMFEKIKFVEIMNLELLTQQINDSYLIARNHENEKAQKILGDYLEKTMKSVEMEKGKSSDLPEIVPVTKFNLNLEEGQKSMGKNMSKKFKFKKIAPKTDALANDSSSETLETKKEIKKASNPTKESSHGAIKNSYKFKKDPNDAAKNSHPKQETKNVFKFIQGQSSTLKDIKKGEAVGSNSPNYINLEPASAKIENTEVEELAPKKVFNLKTGEMAKENLDASFIAKDIEVLSAADYEALNSI